MFAIRVALVLGALLCAIGCDGTVTGIGRTPREPETPLPPAPVESAVAGPEGQQVPRSDQPEMIAAKHLLVMHVGSKSAPRSIKRSRDEARARAQEALARIKGGEPFDKAVAEYTDEPGGAARHGDLGGMFKRDAMVKPFSDAAFALDVGQVSTVIETPFGFHVIKRTE
jgi:peptidyl-prolyl cis-trans isomerase NIMA-interacting 1